MLSKNVEKALNDQIEAEMASSQYYLAMASWVETQGLEGVSNFLYRQSDEEREHMLKLVKYVNERGGSALVPALTEPPRSFDSINDVFSRLLYGKCWIRWYWFFSDWWRYCWRFSYLRSTNAVSRFRRK